MYTNRTIAPDTLYVGASDRRLSQFENLFPIPRGVSYNSYLIVDEKTVLLDTADKAVCEHYYENVSAGLQGRPLDYLVIDHMEPDHAATLGEALRRWPNLQLVVNAKTLPLLQSYYPAYAASACGALVVKEGDALCLGRHTLRFLMAPMVHWPEVMMTFDEATGMLFSADAFGTFGALCGTIFADELDFARDWLDDARRYYANIVGKYGAPVQAVLKKAAALDIRGLAPLHGPIWRRDVGWFIEKYRRWSLCQPEEQAVVICYGSMYGNTENAAETLAVALAERGVRRLAVYDVSVTDKSVLIAEAFRASHLVLASPTYNGGLYLPMAALLEDMQALGLHDRTFALVENGSWAPQAGKLMTERVQALKNATLLPGTVTVRGAVHTAEAERLAALADAIVASLHAAG